jgi:hypothetical protein
MRRCRGANLHAAVIIFDWGIYRDGNMFWAFPFLNIVIISIGMQQKNKIGATLNPALGYRLRSFSFPEPQQLPSKLAIFIRDIKNILEIAA